MRDWKASGNLFASGVSSRSPSCFELGSEVVHLVANKAFEDDPWLIFPSTVNLQCIKLLGMEVADDVKSVLQNGGMSTLEDRLTHSCGVSWLVPRRAAEVLSA